MIGTPFTPEEDEIVMDCIKHNKKNISEGIRNAMRKVDKSFSGIYGRYLDHYKFILWKEEDNTGVTN